MVPLFQKVDAGTLGFSDLWAQQNEHRILFPKAAEIGLGILTHWNIKAEIVTSIAVAVLGFTAIFLIIRRTKIPEPARLLLLFMASLWFFSPVQWENWLWGWQLEWFMCMAAVLWAFYFLGIAKPEDRISHPLILAALAAVFATYSLGSGMIIWIAGALVLWLRGARMRQYFFWGAVAICSIAVYYIGYKSPVGHTPFTLFLHKPIDFMEAYLVYIGRPVSAEAIGAALVGVMVLILFGIALYLFHRHQLIKQYAVWIGVIFYAMFAGFVTIAGRLGFGVSIGLSSRYTAFTVVLMIAVTCLIVVLVSRPGLILDKKISQRAVLVVMGLLAVPAIAGSYYNGLQGMRVRSGVYQGIYSCSRAQEPSQTCLYDIYFPSTEIAKQRLEWLKQKGYGGY
jgi:hypothetical protein